MDILELLKRVKIFSSLSEKDLQKILNWSTVEKCKKGIYVFHEGDPSERLYIILKGKVKIVKHSPSGQETILEIHAQGDTIAEVAVIDGRPYPASASCLLDCSLLKIGRSQFMDLIARYPTVAQEIIKGLGKRLRDIVAALSSIAAQPVEKRLARTFLKFSERFGVPSGQLMILDLSLTRQDLADIIGSTVETVIRTMTKLKKENILTWEGKRIYIKDLKALSKLASE